MSTGIIDQVKAQYANMVIDSHDFRGDQTLTVKKGCGLEFFKFLRDDPQLNFFTDFTDDVIELRLAEQADDDAIEG